jgi:hypothetical protein
VHGCAASATQLAAPSSHSNEPRARPSSHSSLVFTCPPFVSSVGASVSGTPSHRWRWSRPELQQLVLAILICAGTTTICLSHPLVAHRLCHLLCMEALVPSFLRNLSGTLKCAVSSGGSQVRDKTISIQSCCASSQLPQSWRLICDRLETPGHLARQLHCT